MTKPKFVEFGGGQDLVQPYVMKNVRFYGFLIPCQKSAVQTLLDERLNTPCGNKYGYGAPVSHILCAFTVTEMATPQGDIGYIEETDVAFWYLSYAWNPLRLRWFLPYVFVDSSYAVTSGREVYGFPKADGIYNIPTLKQKPDNFWMETPVFMGSGKGAQNQRLFEVNKVDSAKQSGHRSFKHEGDLWEDMVQKLFGSKGKIRLPLGPVVSAAEHIFSNRIPFVFLKQFRDVQEPTKACYQSIVEADATLDQFHSGGWLPGQYELNLQSPGNYPLSKDLGIPNGKTPVDFAFWTNFNFTMQTGKEIWNASSK